MTSVILKNMWKKSPFEAICRNCSRTLKPRISVKRCYSIYEPPYLDKGPQVANYPPLNIRLRGYDYPALESFSRYVHRLAADTFGVEAEAYAVPTRTGQVTLFMPSSTNTESEYTLKIHERTVRLDCLPSTVAPLLIETIQLNLPQGVMMTVKEPHMFEEDFRYVPDTMLMEMRQQADTTDQNIRDIKGK